MSPRAIAAPHRNLFFERPPRFAPLILFQARLGAALMRHSLARAVANGLRQCGSRFPYRGNNDCRTFRHGAENRLAAVVRQLNLRTAALIGPGSNLHIERLVAVTSDRSADR